MFLSLIRMIALVRWGRVPLWTWGCVWCDVSYRIRLAFVTIGMLSVTSFSISFSIVVFRFARSTKTALDMWS